MSWWVRILAITTLVACSGSGPEKVGDDDDDDDDDTTSTDTGSGDSGDIGGGFEPWEPVAVGFELDAIHRSDGTLDGYAFEYGGGTYESPPSLFLTFTSLSYFDEGVTEYEQEEQSCIAYGTFDPTPLLPPDQIPLLVPAELFVSYDGIVRLEYSNCAGKVDPAVWGTDAEILLGAFHGAHVGIGLGRMTDYLRDAWSQETLDDYGDAMVGEYIAINDAQDNFVGLDWSTAFVWEWDPVSRQLVDDGNGQLVKVPVETLPSGAMLPEAYIRSISYWFQDFPLLDLENLKDGAPYAP